MKKLITAVTAVLFLFSSMAIATPAQDAAQAALQAAHQARDGRAVHDAEKALAAANAAAGEVQQSSSFTAADYRRHAARNAKVSNRDARNTSRAIARSQRNADRVTARADARKARADARKSRTDARALARSQRNTDRASARASRASARDIARAARSAARKARADARDADRKVRLEARAQRITDRAAEVAAREAANKAAFAAAELAAAEAAQDLIDAAAKAAQDLVDAAAAQVAAEVAADQALIARTAANEVTPEEIQTARDAMLANQVVAKAVHTVIDSNAPASVTDYAPLVNKTGAVSGINPVSTTDFDSLVTDSSWLAQSADIMGVQTSDTSGGTVFADHLLVDGKAYYLVDGTLVIYHAADAGLAGDQGTLEFIDAHDGFQNGGVAAGESITFADISNDKLGYFGTGAGNGTSAANALYEVDSFALGTFDDNIVRAATDNGVEEAWAAGYTGAGVSISNTVTNGARDSSTFTHDSGTLVGTGYSIYTKHTSSLILGGTITTSLSSDVQALLGLDCAVDVCGVTTTGIAKDATITTLDSTSVDLVGFKADTSSIANWSADIVHFSSAGVVDADDGDLIPVLNTVSTSALIVQSMGNTGEYSINRGIDANSNWLVALHSSTLLDQTIFVGAVDMIDDANTLSYVESTGVVHGYGVGGLADERKDFLASSRVASHYADNFVVDFGADGYGGHSVANASARVAGKAALLMQKFPTQSAGEIKARILSTATDLGAPGVDSTYGHGLVNLSAAMSINL